MKDLALGIDIGGTNTVFGCCDCEGNVHFETSVPTTDSKAPELLVERIYDRLHKEGLIDRIIGVGIGAPNGNYFSGSIEFAPNLSWKGKIPLAQLFHDKFGVPTYLTNDANAAAMGEMIYGNAKDLKDFVTVTLGTGLGSGIVVDGKMIYGHDGFAGEYGHIRVIPNGRLCGCGRRGCLETYVSATGVVRSIIELDSKHKNSSSILTSMDHPSAVQVFKHAKTGDKFAQEIIDFTAKMLGNALADFACFSSPKAYVLFGGIAQSGKEFADKVKTHMEEALLNIYKNKIEIRISALHELNAAVLGASSLVWNEIN